MLRSSSGSKPEGMLSFANEQKRTEMVDPELSHS